MSVIAVFGATGRTGLPLVRKALDAGHSVRALVRTPQKLAIQHPNLTVIPGSSLDAPRVDETIRGANGVISVLGPDKNSPPDLMTRSTGYMIDAMNRYDVRRLVSLTGAGVRDVKNDKPGFVDNAIVFIMKNLAGAGARNALIDGANHADLIRRTSLEWTIVRGPRLNDDPATGSYQVGHVGTVPGINLTRADLADFILKEFGQGTYVREMPLVTNG